MHQTPIVRWLCSILLLFSLANTQGQTSLLTTGGEGSGSGGSVSFSVGQVAYVNASSNAGSVSEGVQQPYEVFATTDMALGHLGLEISLFPNPAQSEVFLSVSADLSAAAWSFAVRDLLGRQVVSAPLSQAQTALPVAHLPAGTYQVVVLRQQSPVHQFTLIKNP